MEDLLSEGNPWEVDSIMEFNFFLCPECEYQTKESTSFKIHAIGTLASLIAVHARLLFFGGKIPPKRLIKDCTFIEWDKFSKI